MIAYEPLPWHDLFTAAAGAAATLAGLIFVAVALNHEQILKQAALPALAARSVSVLVGLVIVSLLGLAPGQDSRALGTEILVLGALLLVGAIATTMRAMNSETRLMWKISLLSVAVFSTAPMVIGGISVLARAGGGLYWVLTEMVCGLAASIYYAWILLIEIRR